ncbi:MAG: hypothetical protein NTV51_17500 [Verrucomicrobia bacterium]|nr:hypothetical protein [Verrucomicrobiota bacterium]
MAEAQSGEDRRRAGRVLAMVVGTAVALYGVVSWAVPPELFNDTAAGYQVWLAMRAGGPFNCNVGPTLDNLAESVATFQSWWAPGQYLVPGFFQLLGLSLGRATLVVVALGSVLRIWGYWRLWLACGVAPLLAAECGIVAVFARPFSGYFGNPYVGDVLQAAAVPWLAILVWRWRELRGWQCAALIPVLMVAVGLKLSVLVAVLAMLAWTVVENVRRAGPAVEWRRAGGWAVRAALVFVAVKLAWDWGYLKRGASIGAAGGLSFPSPAEWSEALAGPLFSALGVQSLLNRIFLFPGAPLLTIGQMWPLFLAGAVGTAVVGWVVWRKFPVRGYVVQAAVWVGVYAAAFAWFHATGASVSLEERHYLPAGMLLLPCTVFALRHSGGRAWRAAGTLLLVVMCGYGVASFAVNVRHRAKAGAVGRHGFSHTTLTRGALAELHRLDAEPGSERTVFYVTMPEIGLEVRQGRTITIPAEWWSEAIVRRFRYSGRVPRLVLVLPKTFVANGKVDLVKGEFPDYGTWREHEVDGFLFIEGD